MNKRLIILICTSLLLAVSNIYSLNLKLASLLPEGTEWDLNLKKMASDWSEISDGRVKIKIYAGGIVGSEADVIRKMRIGQIDMAVLTSVGMTAIYPDSFAMSIPFLLDSEEELDYILSEFTPQFEKGFEENGFIMLAWAKSGWINIFSNKPVYSPQDLMALKFAGSVTQPGISEAFTNMGFNVVPVDVTDVLMGLQSGMIDSFYGAPMAAASYQWFALAPNMMNIKLSPVIGGIIISERAWKKVPDKYHTELLAAAKDMASGFYSEAARIEAKAINVMLDNGLQINDLTIEDYFLWKSIMVKGIASIVGDNKIVSYDTYEEVTGKLEEFRNR